jgi:hypothetical protein
MAIRTDSLALLDATQAPLRSRFPKDSKSCVPSTNRGARADIWVGPDDIRWRARRDPPDWDRAHEEHRSEAPSYCLMSVHWGAPAVNVAAR